MKRTWVFLAGFALVALVIAGGLSYFADADPDGLDSATREGCDVVRTVHGEELAGSCIAQRAGAHDLADGPLAGYSVGGDSRFTGVAGVVGVVATLGISFGLFRLLRRRTKQRT
ncbi:MAG TPA: PDGLE domain-containing protein [Actinophytocola sp.]|nr:PDGLE domain-containing protein [Actinophytocola sp.]